MRAARLLNLGISESASNQADLEEVDCEADSPRISPEEAKGVQRISSSREKEARIFLLRLSTWRPSFLHSQSSATKFEGNSATRCSALGIRSTRRSQFACFSAQDELVSQTGVASIAQAATASARDLQRDVRCRWTTDAEPGVREASTPHCTSI